MGFQNKATQVSVEPFVDPVQGYPTPMMDAGGLEIITLVFSTPGPWPVFTGPSPPRQFVARLHSCHVNNQPGGWQLFGSNTGFTYAQGIVADGPGDLVPGQLITEGLEIIVAGATGDWRVSIAYDYVAPNYST